MRGFPVSVLFPTTAPLYRAAGWELAGCRYETVLGPGRSWRSRVPTGIAGGVGPAAHEAPKVRRATPADGAAIVEVKGLVHEQLRHCGPNTREPWMVADWLDDEDHFAYLADDGFLSYRWADEQGRDRGRRAHRRLAPRRPGRSGRSWPRTPPWPAGSGPASPRMTR